ncbi:hypothetical protein GU926_09725 [Nibribacter ruber]|uniref:Translocation protein TolB n=1 Tax=Nibribacter ruber TaxID=2698458 RepID=A0A6P1P1S1_9BACT|nr:hypothetical protein [Nibribacter ruber]QHL87702.1 hypothetical protein GU926_09725 [Nibribacter ruber]
MSQLYTRFGLICQVCLLLWGMGNAFTAQAQATSPDDFGKNRIQYKRFAWQYYSTPNFNVYYAQGGVELARHAAEHSEKELKRITSLIGYYPYSKITLIVYNSVADLKQSNIGLVDDPYKGGNDGMFVQTKIEIPFEGSQAELKRQISYRISELLISDMMYGGSLKEVIQSNYLLRLPDWFVSGAAAYISEGWGVEMDNYVRDMILKTGGKRPDPLFARNQRLTGQAIWNYITERHGPAAIQNILNLTRITRDIEIGIASSLNMPFKQFEKNWFSYYLQMNTFTEGQLTTADKDHRLRKINARHYQFSEPVYSPSGKQLAYVLYDRGAYKVIVRNLDRGSQKVIYRGGFKVPNQQTDRSVPILAWKSETILGISDYRKGVLKLHQQAANKRYFSSIQSIKRLLGGGKNEISLNAYSQMTGFDYSDDGQMLVMSAVKNNQSDLFLFRGNRLSQQLTNDVYDDLQPSFVPGGSGKIVFSSNRMADSLQAARGKFASTNNNFDIFLYDPTATLQRFWQLSSTPSKEEMPKGISPEELVYVGEESGVRSLYRHNMSTGVINRVTNFAQNIKSFDYHAGTGNLAFVAIDRSKEYPFLYQSQPLAPVSNPEFKTGRQQTLEGHLQRRAQLEADRLYAKAVADSLEVLKAPDSTLVRTDSTLARTDSMTTPPKAAPAKPRTILAMGAADTLSLTRSRAYDLRFGVNNIISSVYADPLLGFGFVMEVGMADLFEDYRIRGGVFALTDLKTTNFYAEYSNLKNRYDYRIGYQKQSVYMNDRPFRRLSKHEVLPAFSYPLTHALSVKVLPRYSNVRFSIIENFSIPDAVIDFGGIGGEIVFDNSVVTGMNMREGTRMKVGVTRMYGLGNKSQGFGKFYVDLRHYQKIHKELVWANRLSYGHSFGPSPKKFLLGGVDNWLNAQDDTTVIDNTTTLETYAPNFFYLDFATPMRGFNYNARNGTRYVLWNTELRLPIFQYLFEGPINSGFFRNLQLAGFFDAGTAYNSGNPFSEDNSVNTQPVPRPPFEVVVRNFRNPFMFGYGGGVRTTLLGVYGRFDIAWGEKDLVREGPKLYFSMGYDF